MVHSRGIQEKGPLHEQRPREGVHVGDEIVHRRQFLGIGDLGADVVCKSVGGDIVRGQKRAINQVAQAHCVTGLEANGAHGSFCVGVRRNLGQCGEVGLVEVRPVERDECRGDLREAGDLDFRVLVFRVQNCAGLVVDDDVALCGL